MFNATDFDGDFYFDYNLRGSEATVQSFEAKTENFIGDEYLSIFACIGVGMVLGAAIGYKFFHPQRAAGYIEIN